MAKLDFGAPLIPNKMVLDDDNESIDETHSIIKKERQNHSVDDLLHAIDKNISSASFHSDRLLNNNSHSFNSDASDDQSPIRPLSFKQQHQQHQQNLNDILNSVQEVETPVKENLMQDIPRAPSFDELEFNTKVNRTSSLSRLSGPRQLSSSSISRSLSNRLPNSSSYKSISGQSSRDNSPSKKSVCFENSPPKIMEYEEFTPEHSDNEHEIENEEDSRDPFHSNWKASIKSTIHPLPPLPPKHSFGAAVSSPTKETSLGSLDGSFEDDNNENIELTKDEIIQDKQALTLEKKLDLVLGSNAVSERVQNDEITRGSSTPSKSLTKREEELVYNIKTKDEIEAEQSLRDAANMFEVDLRNNDKESRKLALAPELRRKNSNNSLRDEERELTTTVVQNVETPLVSGDGLRTIDTQEPQQAHNTSNDDLMSFQSALTNNESFESATEVINIESEDEEGPIDEDTNQEFFMRSLDKSSDYESNNSISTIKDQNTPNTHKKKLSLSESINSGLSYISSFGRNVKGVMHKRTESGNIVETSAEDDPIVKIEDKDKDVVEISQLENFGKPSASVVDNQDAQSYQSSVTETDYETPRNSVDPSSELNNGTSIEPMAERLPLLENQTAEPTPQLSIDESQNDETIDLLDLAPPLKISDEYEEGDSSFSDEFKETDLFNISGSSQNDRSNPTGLQIQFNNDKPDEVPTEELDEDSLNDIEDSIKSNNSSFLKYEPEPEEFEQSFHQEIKREDAEDSEELEDPQPQPKRHESDESDEEDNDDFLTPTFKADSFQSQEPEPRGTLPSFNSTLFNDKVPEDEDDALDTLKTPPTDYISIWHNLPKSASPKPQYSTSLRKVSPPQRVLKLLSRRISSGGNGYVEDSKRNSVLSEGSVDLSRRSSLVATSVSRPSFIRVNSRNSLLNEVKKEDISDFGHSLRPNDSSIYTNRSFRDHGSSILAGQSFKKEEDPTVNSSNILGNSSDLKLPEYNNSSDFANAFKDWAIDDQVDNTNILKDLEGDETDHLVAAKKLKDPTNKEDIKNIWENGSEERTPTPDTNDKSRTPSIDAGKLKNFIEQNGVKGENANVRSSEALGEVLVTKDEDHGIELEFEHDSHYNSFNNSKMEPREVSHKPQEVELSPKESEEHFVDAQEQLQQTPVTRILSDDLSPKRKRFISGSSQKLDDIIDLNEEFNRALQIKEHGYATRQSNQIIVAKSTGSDLLDPNELSKPLVPAVDNADYNQRQQNLRSRYGDRVPSTRIRKPLSSVGGENSANIQADHVPAPSRPSAGVRISSDDYKPGELAMKKREFIQTSKKSVLVPNEDVALPKSDHGRLYIHINSLNDVILDQIKYHKATFKIFLDNGKHVVTTPKLTLDNNVFVDKEFEIAVEENITDLFFTMKINYHTPDQELVEVVEKVPIKSNRLSRIMGLKPKFIYEKKFITRKTERDVWDDKFANDGSFGKNKIAFARNDNEFTGITRSYQIELFNEWETVKQSHKIYKKPAHLVGKLDVTMLFIPRTSPLETLPPSIKIGYKIAEHLKEQSGIAFEGYLFQEGGDCELWKRRYFKLQGTKFIAHQEVTKKPRAQINLLKCVDVLHDGKKNGNSTRNFTDEILMSDCFKLKFLNGEIINFNAETKELKDQWITKLERIVELNKFHQPWVKTLTQNM